MTSTQTTHRATRAGLAVVLGCWALVIIVEASSLRAPAGAKADVGPGFIPLILGALLVALLLPEISLPLTKRSRSHAGADVSSGPASPDRRQWLFLAAVVVSAGVTFVVGVLPAVAALVFWSMYVVEKRSLAHSSLTTAVLVISLYLLFSTLLNVRIPLLPV